MKRRSKLVFELTSVFLSYIWQGREFVYARCSQYIAITVVTCKSQIVTTKQTPKIHIVITSEIFLVRSTSWGKLHCVAAAVYRLRMDSCCWKHIIEVWTIVKCDCFFFCSNRHKWSKKIKFRSRINATSSRNLLFTRWLHYYSLLSVHRIAGNIEDCKFDEFDECGIIYRWTKKEFNAIFSSCKTPSSVCCSLQVKITIRRKNCWIVSHARIGSRRQFPLSTRGITHYSITVIEA